VALRGKIHADGDHRQRDSASLIVYKQFRARTGFGAAQVALSMIQVMIPTHPISPCVSWGAFSGARPPDTSSPGRPPRRTICSGRRSPRQRRRTRPSAWVVDDVLMDMCNPASLPTISCSFALLLGTALLLGSPARSEHLSVGQISSRAFSGLIALDAGFDDRSSTLLRLDTATGVGTILAETHTLLDDIAFAPDGTLYAIEPALFSVLVRIDPDSGQVTRIGESPWLAAGRVVALAVSRQGVLFGASSDGLFMVIDPLTGRSQLRGSFGLQASGGMTFSEGGTLYASIYGGTTVTDYLATIDIGTGRAAIIGRIGFSRV
jgi:hypothetical protein